MGQERRQGAKCKEATPSRLGRYRGHLRVSASPRCPCKEPSTGHLTSIVCVFSYSSLLSPHYADKETEA